MSPSAERELPRYVVADRQEGKTTALVEWVKAGERTDRYPGWTRVLVVPTIEREVGVRALYGLDPHQIYHLDDLRSAHRFDPECEVALDDVDLFLSGLLNGRGRLCLVSATGEPAPASPVPVGDDDCVSCGEGNSRDECPRSKRPCGHHCNHSWSHDGCDWCGAEFGEVDAPAVPVGGDGRELVAATAICIEPQWVGPYRVNCGRTITNGRCPVHGDGAAGLPSSTERWPTGGDGRQIVLYSNLGLSVWQSGVGYLDAGEIATLAEELRDAANEKAARAAARPSPTKGGPDDRG